MNNVEFRVWNNFLKTYLGENNFTIDPLGNVLDFEGYPYGDVVLERYTGLKDVNGVKIFEGDIICQQMRFVETNGLIFWEEEKARFSINLDGFITTITKPQEHSYEVVGNIHKNPELLKEPDYNI